MIEFGLTIEIDRPPEDVFAYLTDPQKLPEWQTSTVEVSQDSDGPLGKGTRLREVHAAFGRRLESLVEVVEYEPSRRFALHIVSGPLPVDGSWELAAGDGGTRLHFAAHGRAPRALRLLEPLMARMMRRQFAGHHQRLKTALER